MDATNGRFPSRVSTTSNSPPAAGETLIDFTWVSWFGELLAGTPEVTVAACWLGSGDGGVSGGVELPDAAIAQHDRGHGVADGWVVLGAADGSAGDFGDIHVAVLGAVHQLDADAPMGGGRSR